MNARTHTARMRRMLAAMLVCACAGLARAEHQHAGECSEGQQMSVMFAPGTLPQNNLDYQPYFVIQGGRWYSTATDGPVEQGEPITITYSFLFDGTYMETSYAPEGTTSNLRFMMNSSFPGGFNAFEAIVDECFARWSELSNITYVKVSDDGADFPTTPGELGARGDVRIGMHAVGEGPLAFNYYPVFGGDMVLDSLDMDTFANPSGNFRGLRNVLLHEHGHGLGLGHIEPALNTHLMEPQLSLAFDGPQEDDIRGVQHNYGDWAESNDGIGSETFVGGPLRDPAESGEIVLNVEDVALERADSSDWYGFTSFGQTPIAIRVEPIGSTYEAGPQDGVSTLVDGKGARDLAFRLWRRVSADTNQLQFVAEIDFNEAGEDEYHPPVPYTLAGYMLLEVYSTDNVNDAQRYRVTISNAAIEQNFPDPVMSISSGLNQVFDGTIMQFGQVTVGESAGIALTIRNLGEGPLTFPEAPSVQGPAAGDFAVGDINGEIAPDGVAILTIGFTPTAPGVRQAVLTIPNNDPTQPDFGFILSGSGVAPVAPQPVEDCNENGAEDADDIASGESADCNTNGTPDECETDFDGDGFIDDCDNCPDAANPDQTDTDSNGLGDACDELEVECPDVFEPVCGVDGETYSSGCDAFTAGVEVLHDGPCQLDGPPEDNGDDDGDIDDNGDEEDDNGDDNEGDVDDDDNNDNDGNDDNEDDDGDAKIDDEHEEIPGICGAGTLGMIPMMMAGLCGLRNRRNPRTA